MKIRKTKAKIIFLSPKASKPVGGEEIAKRRKRKRRKKKEEEEKKIKVCMSWN